MNRVFPDPALNALIEKSRLSIERSREIIALRRQEVERFQRTIVETQHLMERCLVRLSRHSASPFI